MKHVVRLLALAFFISCKAKENNQATETLTHLSDSIALQQTVDSVSNVRKDGTQTTSGTSLPEKQQLPSALEVFLDQQHGLWRYPTLSAQDLARIPADAQGPYYLQADFNGDQQEDFAVQIVERDSAVIMAVLSTGDNTWKEYVLEKHPLTRVNGEKRSLYYLTLAPKAGDKAQSQIEKPLTLPQHGISVGRENTAATYVFEKDAFQQYQSGD